MFWPWRKKTEVWLDGFKEGFSKGVDMKSVEIKQILNRVEEEAIRKAIDRLGKK